VDAPIRLCLDSCAAGGAPLSIVVRPNMKAFATFGAVLSLLLSGWAGESMSPTNAAAKSNEVRFQRFLADMQAASTRLGIGTNPNPKVMRMLFDQMVVDPSFGLGWDEVPAPTSVGTNAMASVQAFVATNGWNMQTAGVLFTYGIGQPSSIRGLPWEAIREREFQAVTHGGILYVVLTAWVHDCNGVAYNPKTNGFPSTISGFKPIGQHWYAWAQREPEMPLTQRYEGQEIGELDGAANRSQPVRSETNSTSAAAGSGR
jgi:hypothetical protein